jgi:hypothetical protein
VDGFEAGAAKAVHVHRRHGVGQARVHAGVARHVGGFADLAADAHDDGVHVVAGELGALEGFLNNDGAEFVGLHIAERALEPADSGADAINNDYFFHVP